MPSTFQTLLVVIRPTTKPDEEKVKLSALASSFGPHVKEAVALLIDSNNTHVHDCETNTEAIKSVLKFLKTQLE